MPKIFISYRRDDSVGVTGRIHDHLSSAFGKEYVFQDVDSIPPGVDFRRYLQQEIAACDVILVIIGKQWVMVEDTHGRRRLQNPTDFVRIEIESALQQNKTIIPVLVDNAAMPTPDELPTSLYDLCYRNSVVVRHNPDFLRDMERLIEGLRRLIIPSVPSASSEKSVKVFEVTQASPVSNVSKQSALLETAIEMAWNFDGTKNTDWQPFVWNFNDTPMMLVPRGYFMMGSEDDNSEKPVHQQCIDRPFWIDKYPVSNADYHQAVEAGACEPPHFRKYYEDIEFALNPVVHVNWFQAKSYAQWRGCTLPTEMQWEYAAKGVEAWIYPWGNDFIRKNAFHSSNAQHVMGKGMSPTESASWVGVAQMSGNVWEWCNSVNKPYPYTPESEKSSANISSYIVRGGSWRSFAGDLRTASRRGHLADEWFGDVGFRCVRPVS